MKLKNILIVMLFIIGLMCAQPSNNVYAFKTGRGSYKTYKEGKYMELDNEWGLYNHSELMCIHRGTKADGKYKRFNKLNFDDTAQKTDETRAIMALIAAYSKGKENDNAGTNYPITSRGRYWNSYSQNAVWKYWKTFYDKNKKEYKIDSRFSKTSNPKSNSSAQYLIRKGYDYYNSINGNNMKVTANPNGIGDFKTYGNRKKTGEINHCHKLKRSCTKVEHTHRWPGCYNIITKKLKCTREEHTHSWPYCYTHKYGDDDTQYTYEYDKSAKFWVVGPLKFKDKNDDEKITQLNVTTDGYIGWIYKIPDNYTGQTHTQCSNIDLEHSSNSGYPTDGRLEFGLECYCTEETPSIKDGKKGIYLVFNKDPGKVVKGTLKFSVPYYKSTINLYRYSGTDKVRQNLLLSNVSNSTTQCEVDFEFNKEDTPGLSIEKVITAVGKNFENNTLSNAYTWNGQKVEFQETNNESEAYLTNRENMKRYTSDTEPIANMQYNGRDKSRPMDPDKLNNPVEIGRGNYVVYKITVFSEGNSNKTKKYTITDTFASNKGAQLIGVYDKRDGLQFSDSDINYSEKDGKITIKNRTITTSNYDSIWIVIKYNEAFEGILQNKVVLKRSQASSTCRTKDYDYVTMRQSNISLEKYIVSVNGQNISENRQGKIIQRYEEKDQNEIYSKDIKNTNGFTREAQLFQNRKTKEENPVWIEAGDTVRYAITLYNNGPNDNEEVIVKDFLPYKATKYKWSNKGSWETKKFGEAAETKSDVVYLKLYEYKTIYIDVKFENYSGNDKPYSEENNVEYDLVGTKGNGVIYGLDINEAQISSTKFGNATSEKYRYVDADFIKMKSYIVDINKSVSRIKNGKDWRKPTEAEKSGYSVESGDIVEYAITVENYSDPGEGQTSRSGDISIAYINDTFTHKNGYRLNYISCEESQNDSINSTGDANSSSVTLELKNIQNGSTRVFYAYFYVDIEKDLTKETHTFDNKISMKGDSIKNKNGVIVKNIYGDRESSVSVKSKIYKISLEKYVEEEKGDKLTKDNCDITNREGIPEYKDGKKKYDDPVLTSQGSSVKYILKLTNDGSTVDGAIDNATLSCAEIDDNRWPESSIEGEGGRERKILTKTVEGTLIKDKYINPQGYQKYNYTRKTNESNMSDKTLSNTAEMIKWLNKNGREVLDSTPDDNKDADYIKLKPTIGQKVEITAKKEWVGNNIPVNSVEVTLYANGKEHGKTTLSASNSWKYTWENLPYKDANNVAIRYEVKETTQINGYTSEVKKSTKYIVDDKNHLIEHYTYTIVNKPSELKNVSVQKIWLDDNDNHPNVTVKLIRVANNVKEDVETVTLSEGKWYYEWKDIAKTDKQGNTYTYSVEEISNPKIDGVKYKAKYDVNDNTTIIYNIPDNDKPYMISGTVWNDRAVDKTNTYNALIDDYEHGIENIVVNLYRVENNKATKVADTTTDASGYYCFRDEDIYKTIPAKERFIKGPIENESNRWQAENGNSAGGIEGKYFYTYYIEYEYNGITYTSTPDGQIAKDVSDTENYTINQNAIETAKSRKNINNIFANINNNSDIQYTTSNKNGYIPESNYVYNQETMNAISRVNSFKVNKDIEPQMQYINLGLRGKNVFDLELQSDIYKAEVKVNGQNGLYDYADGKLFLRRSLRDIAYDRYEDDENKYQSGIKYEGQEYNQNIKFTDIDLNKAITGSGSNIDEKYVKNKVTDLQFFVTYKISIKNASNTKGMATQITSYIDDNYEFRSAVDEKGTELSVVEQGTTDNYRYTKINTVTESFYQKYDTKGFENKDMYIYITYELKKENKISAEILNENTKDGKLKLQTRCMTEISGYTTFGTNQVDVYEHCKGLIDKDSAPESANKERVRTIESEGVNTATINGKPTTLEYYLNRSSDLGNLKYEDDTDTSMITIEGKDNIRTLDGKVFEDYTSFKNEENVDDSSDYYPSAYNSEKVIKVKTGNGIQDIDEPGVEGVIVQLMEEVPVNKVKNIYQKANDSGIENAEDSKYYNLVAQTITDANGYFKFESYLPGNYIIRYWYGEKSSAVYSYVNERGESVKLNNNKSYNGEDFQATNNIGEYEARKLNDEKNYWYVFNEADAISSAKDIDERRKDVSEKVTKFTESGIKLLNSIRDGTVKETEINNNNIFDITKMSAVTPLMQLRVEETVDVSKLENTEKDKDNNIIKTDDLGREYIVVDANTNKERSLEVIEKDGNGMPKLATWMEFPSENTQYEKYHISEVDFGISETPVTTVDLQKHVQSIRVTDSTNENVIAEAEIDLSTTQVIVYPKKISATQVDTVVNIIKRVFGTNDTEGRIKKKIENIRKNPLLSEGQSSIRLLKGKDAGDDNYLVDLEQDGITEEQRITLENLIIDKSCAGIFEFRYNWNVKTDNIDVGVGTEQMPIQIDDEKLQGARIEITYKITSSIFAEKSFNNGEIIVPTIKNLVDFVDNDLSYNENLIANGDKPNSYYWTVISREDLDKIFDENGYEKGKGTIDISEEKNRYSTLLTANAVENGLLSDKLGRGEAYITLEKELSSNESTWGDIIGNSIDTYEYDNHVEIVSFDYNNTKESPTNDFVFRDRVRRPNRYTIIAGTQNDTAKAETVCIIPPLGKNKSIAKYIVIASAGIAMIGTAIIIKKKC